MSGEIWKEVPDENYKIYYEISNHGRIRNAETQKIIKPYKAGKYMVVSFKRPQLKLTRYSVHRLVACVFVEDPDDDPEKDVVNHKDGNKLNNHFQNLEWCTVQENVRHARDVLKQKKTTKCVISTSEDGIETKYESIVSAAKILKIRRQYITECARGQRESIKGLTWRYENENHNSHEVDIETMTEIERFPGYYINTSGEIYGVSKSQFLKHNMSDGYPKVLLYKNGKPESFYVHVLVAKTFIPNPDGKLVVNHIDNNNKNCDISNLEWVTHSENSIKYHQHKKLSVLNLTEKSLDGSVENAEVQVESENVQGNPEPSS